MRLTLAAAAANCCATHMWAERHAREELGQSPIPGKQLTDSGWHSLPAFCRTLKQQCVRWALPELLCWPEHPCSDCRESFAHNCTVGLSSAPVGEGEGPILQMGFHLQGSPGALAFIAVLGPSPTRCEGQWDHIGWTGPVPPLRNWGSWET